MFRNIALSSRRSTSGLKSAPGAPPVTSSKAIEIRRNETDLAEAVWFGALVAGFDGRIADFTDEILRIE